MSFTPSNATGIHGHRLTAYATGIHGHRLTAYATKEGVPSEIYAHLKIVQTLVTIGGFHTTLNFPPDLRTT